MGSHVDGQGAVGGLHGRNGRGGVSHANAVGNAARGHRNRSQHLKTSKCESIGNPESGLEILQIENVRRISK